MRVMIVLLFLKLSATTNFCRAMDENKTIDIASIFVQPALDTLIKKLKNAVLESSTDQATNLIAVKTYLENIASRQQNDTHTIIAPDDLSDLVLLFKDLKVMQICFEDELKKQNLRLTEAKSKKNHTQPEVKRANSEINNNSDNGSPSKRDSNVQRETNALATVNSDNGSPSKRSLRCIPNSESPRKRGSYIKKQADLETVNKLTKESCKQS